MEISKTRTIKINMGNYEHWEEFFRVTTNTDDLRVAGYAVDGASLEVQAKMIEDFADKKLDEQTLAFITRASKLTACQESAALDPDFATAFVHSPPTPAKATATAKKTTRRA